VFFRQRVPAVVAMMSLASGRSRGWLPAWVARAALGLALAGLALAIVASGALAATTPVTVTLGAVLPLTGTDAAAGQAAEHGAQLAVEQANSGHLVPSVSFGLAAKSDAGSAGIPDGVTGATQIKALISNAQVAGVIGPSDTTTALAELPLANRAPVATVSPSASDTCLTITAALGCTATAAELPTVQPTGRTTFFRVAPSDALQGAALADFSFSARHDKTAYVVHDGTAVGAAQAGSFTSRWQNDGGVLLGDGTASSSGDDINLLTAIATTRPDVIIFTGSDAQAGTALRQQMLQVPALASTPFAATSSVHVAGFAQTIGALGGPVWATAPEPQLGQLPSAATFATQYQKQFGTPDVDAARGYDVAEALLNAVKTAVAGGAQPPVTTTGADSSFRAAVISAIARTTFTGADGSIAFAPDGDLRQGPVEVDLLSAAGATPSWVPAAVEQVTSPAPTATLTPTALGFGSVPTHGGTSTLTLHLNNTGISPFGVSSVSVTGTGFRLASTTCTPANVVAGAGCNVSVRFTPPATSTFSGKVAVSDPAGPSPQTSTLAGTGTTPAPLTVTSATLVRGGVAVPYAASLSASGGIGPYHWSLAGGALPPGLTLNPATGAVTGTPTTPGTFTPTVKVTDSATTGAQTATRVITLTIAAPVAAAVYVVNGANSSVRAFGLPAAGNATPLSILVGPATQLNGTAGVAVDGSGGVYVANAGANSITEYPPGATGNAAPSAVLSGQGTGLSYPSAVVLDSNGFLYVANQSAGTVTVYAPGATGDPAPVRTITGLSGPDALAVDTAGDLWIANVNTNSIARYAKSAAGNAAPLAMIAGTSTQLDSPDGLTLDPAGDVLVTNEFADSITTYTPTATGNIAPISVIAGSATRLDFPAGFDVDAHGNIYVSNQFANAINVYAAGANGNVAPTAFLTGAATGLSAPGHLAVTPPLTILTRRLQAARVGRSYRARAWAALGVAPYRWSVKRGRLPRGLRLHAANGEITGTPRRAGAVRILLEVTDHTRPATSATRSVTLRVASAAPRGCPRRSHLPPRHRCWP
jgi:branched-chain amino acid transport system substrate-binding protein